MVIHGGHGDGSEAADRTEYSESLGTNSPGRSAGEGGAGAGAGRGQGATGDGGGTVTAQLTQLLAAAIAR
jgi:hypothetical protein